MYVVTLYEVVGGGDFYQNLQILKQKENRVETPFCITHNIFQSLDNAESMISSSKVSIGKGVKLRNR